MQEKELLRLAAESLKNTLDSFDPLVPKDHAKRGIEILEEWSKKCKTSDHTGHQT